MSGAEQPIGVVGVGYVGLVTASASRISGIASSAGRRRGEDRGASRGDVPIYEPGLDKLIDDNAERLSFTTSYDELLSAVPHPVHRRRHAADAVGRRRPLARAPRRRRGGAQRGGRRLLVMKSTVPVGTGERVVAELEATGRRRRSRYVVQPRVPARGRGDPGLPRARPHRHRLVPTTRTATRSRRSTAASTRRSCAPACPPRR